MNPPWDEKIKKRLLEHGLNPNGNGTNEKMTVAKERQASVVKMRKDGYTFAEIADHFKVTIPTIHAKFKAAMKQVIYEDINEIRKLELARLDQLHYEAVRVMNKFHPILEKGSIVRGPWIVDGREVMDENGDPIYCILEDSSIKLNGIRHILAIMERRAKLLGLDAPTKTALTDPTGEKESSIVQFYIPDNRNTEDAQIVE